MYDLSREVYHYKEKTTDRSDPESRLSLK